MAIGIGEYSARGNIRERTEYGVTNGAAVGALAATATAVVSSLRAKPGPLTNRLTTAALVGATTGAGVAAGHIIGGSDNARFNATVGGAALAGAGSGALVSSFGRGFPPATTRLALGVGLGAAAGAGIGLIDVAFLDD